jgi:hypothetical protein
MWRPVCEVQDDFCRHFSATELRDLFAISEEGLQASQTAAQLAELQSSRRKYPAEIEEHLKVLSSIEYYQTTSDHSLVATFGGTACGAVPGMALVQWKSCK